MKPEHFDTIAETLIDAIITDTNQIETWTRRGHQRHADLIIDLGNQRQSRLDALEQLKEQTGFNLTNDQVERLRTHGTPLDRKTLRALRAGLK